MPEPPPLVSASFAAAALPEQGQGVKRKFQPGHSLDDEDDVFHEANLDVSDVEAVGAQEAVIDLTQDEGPPPESNEAGVEFVTRSAARRASQDF